MTRRTISLSLGVLLCVVTLVARCVSCPSQLSQKRCSHGCCKPGGKPCCPAPQKMAADCPDPIGAEKVPAKVSPAPPMDAVPVAAEVMLAKRSEPGARNLPAAESPPELYLHNSILLI